MKYCILFFINKLLNFNQLCRKSGILSLDECVYIVEEKAVFL